MKLIRRIWKLATIFLLIVGVLTVAADSPKAVLYLTPAGGDLHDPFADLVVGVPHEDIFELDADFEDVGIFHLIYSYPQGLGAQDTEIWNQDMEFSQDEVERGDGFGFALATGDFNGDGLYDLAVGVPFEDIEMGFSEKRSAGAVHVIYGSSSGGFTTANNQFWHQDSPNVPGTAEQYDNFGKSLAVGNFNGDDYDDLAIGVSFEDFEYGTVLENGGSVIVMYGSAGGLNPTAVLESQMWHQDSDDGVPIKDAVEAYDIFGHALAAGDFDNDNYDDLAVGAPGEDSAVKNEIGVVHVIYGTEDGLSAARNQQWEQYDWGGSAESEDGDFFGFSLAVGNFGGNIFDDLAIGVPTEDIEVSPGISIEDAGAVNVLFGSENGLDDAEVRFAFQDGEDIEETAEEGDEFGYSVAAVDFHGRGLDYLVVGVPYEDLGDPLVKDAGALHVLTLYAHGGFLSSPSHFFHQGRGNIPDELEFEDKFGNTLVGGDFNGDGEEELAVGNPYDSCQEAEDGSVVVIYDTAWDREGITSPQHWCQGEGLGQEREPQDHFGYALAVIPGSGSLPHRSYLPFISLED